METYEQLKNRDSFKPNKLSCAVDKNDLTKTESTYEKIIVFVTYHTVCIDKNGKQCLLPIGLDNGVTVRTLLWKPKHLVGELFLMSQKSV